jgi:hypothetical protein
VPPLSEVWYLGHIISPKGITTDPEILKAIREWPTLNKYKIRCFQALFTYCRQFISSFANVLKPVTKLTEEKQAIQWTPEVEAAFQTLKEALCLPLFLLTRSQERGSSLT